MFEFFSSSELSTPISDVSLDDSYPSTEINFFYSKLVSMGTCTLELTECNKEYTSMPYPSFVMVFKF